VIREKVRLLRWGTVVGLNHGLTGYLMFILKDHNPNTLFCVAIFLVHFAFSLPGLLLRGDRQVDWYRRSFFVPLTLPWGMAVLGAAMNFDALCTASLAAAMLAVFVTPVIWLIGALWLWRSNRGRMREVGA
jgi:hypothetical protein